LLNQLTERIAQLPENWHRAGPLSNAAIAAIERHCAKLPITHSVETGCGKSTLLLSHLSEHHIVFTLGENDDSHVRVLSSTLLNTKTVEWVYGPTQRTLPAYHFGERIQLALIDGPHGYPFPQMEYWVLYPHLAEGALLIIDDIQIPTIYQLFLFVRDDAMFSLVDVVGTTAFFIRTVTPLFDPLADGWWLQAYNAKRNPILDWSTDLRPSMLRQLRRHIPTPLKRIARLLAGKRAHYTSRQS
jgi:Methyltransferase domain